MQESKIIILEAISKILLPISIFVFFLTASLYGKIFCFEKDITLFIKLSFLWILLLSVVLEIVALLIRLKLRLPLRRSVFGFLKALLLVFFFGVGIYLFLGISPVLKPIARDARRLADLRQIATAQELFYQNVGRYANSQNELVEKGYFSYPLSDPLSAKEYTDKDERGLDGGDEDSNTWGVQVVLENKYERQLCGGKIPTRIFSCGQTGCEYLSEK